ncbi:MAG: hypothetical protein L7S64_02465 [Longimicrobiales bacterium]|nr:hypothetical protein [Longimicrobiales bacterium]
MRDARLGQLLCEHLDMLPHLLEDIDVDIRHRWPLVPESRLDDCAWRSQRLHDG